MTRRRSALALALASVLALTWTLAAADEKPAEEASPGESGWGASHDWDWDHDQQDVSILNDLDVPVGKVHHGDLVCVGGNVTVAGEVTGEVVMVGCSLDLSGSVRGDVVGVISTITLAKDASIDGEMVNVLGSLDNQGARIAGQKVNIPFGMKVPGIKAPFAILGAILFWWTVVGLALFFVGIFLFVALVPHRVRVLSEETPVSILWAMLVGLGVYAVVVVLESLLFFSFIGIPLFGLFHLAFLILKWLGMVGILHYIGSRLGRLFGREFSLVGAVLLAFVLVAGMKLVPFLFGGLLGFGLLLGAKFLVWLFLEVPAVGLIVLTRAGTRPRSTVAPAPTIAVPPVVVPPTATSPS